MKEPNRGHRAYEYYSENLELGPAERTLTWSSVGDSFYSIFYSDDLFTWHLANGEVRPSGNTATSWINDGSKTGIPPLDVRRRFCRTLENP